LLPPPLAHLCNISLVPIVVVEEERRGGEKKNDAMIPSGYHLLRYAVITI